MPRLAAISPRAALVCAIGLGALQPARAAPPRAIPEQLLRAGAGSRADGGLALESDGGGRLRHRGDGFTAIIHPDGSVEFRDRAPLPTLSVLGVDPLRRRLLDPPVERRAPAYAAFADRATFPMGQVPIFGGVSGSMGGLADWTRSQRHVAAKQAFLAATEGLRLRIHHAWHRALLDRRLAELGGELVALWRDPRAPLAERKRRLFHLWDECVDPAESPRSPLDELRIAAGRAARAKIEAYVRRVAPAGSPDAYSPTELAALNAARRSAAPFNPYTPVDEVSAPALPPDPPPAPPGPAPAPEWAPGG